MIYSSSTGRQLLDHLQLRIEASLQHGYTETSWPLLNIILLPTVASAASGAALESNITALLAISLLVSRHHHNPHHYPLTINGRANVIRVWEAGYWCIASHCRSLSETTSRTRKTHKFWILMPQNITSMRNYTNSQTRPSKRGHHTTAYV